MNALHHKLVSLRARGTLLLALAASAVSCAQQNVPHAACAYPAGGRLGSSFEVMVTGQYMDGASHALFSGSGIEAKVTGVSKALTMAQSYFLKEELKALEESQKKQPGTPPWTPERQHRAADIRKMLAESERRQSAPSLSETVSLQVTIAADAAMGDHELRLITENGLTNPLVFQVGRLPEFTRPFELVPLQLAAGGGLPLSDKAHAESSPAMSLAALPVTINGQTMPGAQDRFLFHVRKGQRIVIAAHTRALIPFISDSVPGWFQASIALLDPAGRQLASSDHFRFNQESLIEQEIAEDGDYTLEVHDILYRGREDFVYRIDLGELPFVTGIFPLGAKAGAHAKVELTGWNLPTYRFADKSREAGLHLLAAGNNYLTSYPLLFDADTLPESAAKRSASTIKSAQRLKLPTVIDGRIAHPGETAVFRIDAKTGDEIVAEVIARRLGSPLDSTLTLSDAKGRQLAFNDDFDDKSAPLLTHQADSQLSYRFTASGAYYLTLADAQQNGGPEYAYRLRVSPPRPDFELRLASSSINLHPGETVAVPVVLLRRDGFAGEVALRLLDAPDGMALGGGVIPAGADSVRITLTAPGAASAGPHRLLLEGQAQIAGRVVRHTSLPADDRMQAFAWHHLVPAQEGLVLVYGKGRGNFAWKMDAAGVKIPLGGSAELHIEAPPGQAKNSIQLALNDPPAGIELLDISQDKSSITVRLRADNKLKPGLRGNLIVEASALRPVAPKNSPPGKNRPISLGTLPAIPFEIAPR